VGFLARIELGLLAAQPPLGLSDLHALAGAQADEIGLELRDYLKLIERCLSCPA
jgi:hypothetical protein